LVLLLVLLLLHMLPAAGQPGELKGLSTAAGAYKD
jgi:hypothetical protein